MTSTIQDYVINFYMVYLLKCNKQQLGKSIDAEGDRDNDNPTWQYLPISFCSWDVSGLGIPASSASQQNWMLNSLDQHGDIRLLSTSGWGQCLTHSYTQDLILSWHEHVYGGISYGPVFVCLSACQKLVFSWFPVSVLGPCFQKEITGIYFLQARSPEETSNVKAQTPHKKLAIVFV